LDQNFVTGLAWRRPIRAEIQIGDNVAHIHRFDLGLTSADRWSHAAAARMLTPRCCSKPFQHFDEIPRA
jgi:hypothetical protein